MKLIVSLAIVAHFSVALWANNLTILEERAQANDPQAAFELAQHFEKIGNQEEALKWYKHSSQIVLGKRSNTKELEQGLLKNKMATIERTQEIYGSLLKSYEDNPKTYSTVEQMMTKVFDIAPYKTNYLLPATYNNVNYADERKNVETKFQLSFQKSLSDNLLGLHETFAIGYTQTSWWQTAENSAPFRETNYQPEIFMVMPHFDTESFIKAYQFGLLHESNGRDIPQSRSWNRVYAKAYLQLGGLIVSPRVWYRIPEDALDDDNPNIEEYLGYGDLELLYPWGVHTFRIIARHNMNFDSTQKGSAQLDWTFPMWDKNLFGYIQLFSGYGESLIDYNKRSDRIGIGFALSR